MREPLSAALPSPQRGTGWSQPEEQRGGSGAGEGGRPGCRWLKAGQVLVLHWQWIGNKLAKEWN